MGRRHKHKPSIEVTKAYAVGNSMVDACGKKLPHYAIWEYDPEPVMRAARALKRHGGRIISKPEGYSRTAVVLVRASPKRHKALLKSINARPGISASSHAPSGGTTRRSRKKWTWVQGVHCVICGVCYADIPASKAATEGATGTCRSCKNLDPLIILSRALL